MKRKLFVSNLPEVTNQQELHALFAQAGEVAATTVMRDRISAPDGDVAYVEMSSTEGARAAVSRFDQYELRGRLLRVRESGTDVRERLSSSYAPARPTAVVPLRAPASNDTHSSQGAQGMLDEGAPVRVGD